MLNGLSLFSGIGGIDLALSEWVRPVLYCEREPYAQGVILSQISRGSLPYAPIWDDVCTLRGDDVGSVDIIYGGFPCQDISVAGNGKGLAGERSGLFYEIIRLTKEIKPSFVFLENVSAIRTRGLREVIRAFAQVGYDCRWTCLSAASVGAPHKRERWFLLAHANSNRGGLQQIPGQEQQTTPNLNNDGKTQSMADSNCKRLEGHPEPDLQKQRQGRFEVSDEGLFSRQYWQSEPNVGRVANGVQARVDRIRGLGNAVVPLQAREAFMRLSGLKPNALSGGK